MTIHLGRPLPGASRDRPGRRRGNPPAKQIGCRPYLVLLPVGFALPPPSPGARCALAAPFRPYRHPNPREGARAGRRCVFCGTVPGVAPAGRYPAPCLRGARTFLPPGDELPKGGHPAVWRPGCRRRPSSRSRTPGVGSPRPVAECARGDGAAGSGSRDRRRRPRDAGGNGAGRRRPRPRWSGRRGRCPRARNRSPIGRVGD